MTKTAPKLDLEVPTLPRQPQSIGFIEHWAERRSTLIKASFASAEFAAPHAEPDSQKSSRMLEPTPVPDLPHFSPVPQRADSFAALQEWEGIVTEVKTRSFTAKLIDITADENEPNETAELLIDDLQEEDILRLKPGAIFRWVIGYAKSAAGTKTRGSRVYFRRMPPRRHGGAKDLIFEK